MHAGTTAVAARSWKKLNLGAPRPGLSFRIALGVFRGLTPYANRQRPYTLVSERRHECGRCSIARNHHSAQDVTKRSKPGGVGGRESRLAPDDFPRTNMMPACLNEDGGASARRQWAFHTNGPA